MLSEAKRAPSSGAGLIRLRARLRKSFAATGGAPVVVVFEGIDESDSSAQELFRELGRLQLRNK
jgi:hypothetical protein